MQWQQWQRWRWRQRRWHKLYACGKNKSSHNCAENNNKIIYSISPSIHQSLFSGLSNFHSKNHEMTGTFCDGSFATDATDVVVIVLIVIVIVIVIDVVVDDYDALIRYRDMASITASPMNQDHTQYTTIKSNQKITTERKQLQMIQASQVNFLFTASRRINYRQECSISNILHRCSSVCLCGWDKYNH